MSGDRYDDPNPGAPLMINEGDVPEPAQVPMDAKKQPKKADRGPIPARQGNGYYANHLTGERLRSVTTILSGGVPKPGLVFWAGNMVADSAIENLPALVVASRHPEQLHEMRQWITKAHTRKKDERAEAGGLVHQVIESRILGTPLPSVIEIGETHWAIDGPELAPFLEHFLQFEADFAPEWLASEMVVANPEHGYAGTLDYTISAAGPIGDVLRAWVAKHKLQIEIPEDDGIMGDTKTGGEWDRITSAGHVHGVYPEAGLQMAAYRKAKIAWLRNGVIVPMPQTAEVGVVLHLRPEGYRLYPVLCGDLQYRYFRHAQMVDEWSSRLSSAKADVPIIGEALVTPTVRSAVV